MPDVEPRRPTLRQKLLFWVILGGFSVFITEILLGSSPYAFFNPWGMLVVCPLYMLHVVVLARIVFWHKRPPIAALYFAGALLGLYEAYMTKQLWAPSWDPNAFRLGGVAVTATVGLALWWHPVMAFLVPLLAAETLLCRSRDVAAALPLRLKRLLFGRHSGPVLFGLAMLGGLLASAAHWMRPTALHVAVSVAGATAVLTALVWLWRRSTRGMRFDLVDLLPTRRQFIVLCVLLGLMYAVLGIGDRPKALPGLGPQLSIWLLYGVFIGGLWLALRRPRRASALELRDPPDGFAWKPWFALAGVLVVTATGARLALGPGTYAFFLIDVLIGPPLGLAIFVLCIYSILSTIRR